MPETCEHLETIYARALAFGCFVGEKTEGWSNARLVIHLLPGMPPPLRADAATAVQPVRYYSSDRTPHNPAGEGFYCDTCKVGLSFSQSTSPVSASGR